MLDRHQAVEPKLDTLRRGVLDAELGEVRTRVEAPPGWLTLLWQELVWPSRQTWAGLAAAWVVIALLQAASHDRPSASGPRANALSPEVMALLEEQRILRAELLGNATVEQFEAPRPASKPRSESAPAWRPAIRRSAEIQFRTMECGELSLALREARTGCEPLDAELGLCAPAA